VNYSGSQLMKSEKTRLHKLTDNKKQKIN